jgi:predicted transcriptional regulator
MNDLELEIYRCIYDRPGIRVCEFWNLAPNLDALFAALKALEQRGDIVGDHGWVDATYDRYYPTVD